MRAISLCAVATAVVSAHVGAQINQIAVIHNTTGAQVPYVVKLFPTGTDTILYGQASPDNAAEYRYLQPGATVAVGYTAPVEFIVRIWSPFDQSKVTTYRILGGNQSPSYTLVRLADDSVALHPRENGARVLPLFYRSEGMLPAFPNNGLPRIPTPNWFPSGQDVSDRISDLF